MCNMPRRYLCEIVLVLLALQAILARGRFNSDEKLCCSDEPPARSGAKESFQKHKAARAPRTSSTAMDKTVVGSTPPSCLNKCASCTPCQLVKALGEDKKIGSSPPSCNNKCNACVPCQAVQTPMSSSNPREEHQEQPREERDNQDDREVGEHFIVGFSNYMPETWKCKCGNQFFSP
ncbi:polygalacturonase [Selaginella moellendorffii]|nr:polygalacturonase [Selaginella moellendorffii]|eukprot:XP_002977463.2 polygalacturonase [Selaginella moellendorffii]